jgi:hypothetical protein
MTCCCLSCRWGEAMSLNCGHQRAYCLSPWWYMNMENNGEMILTGETEELGEKPVPVPLCPLKIQYELTRARIRASVARGRRLTAWATARPNFSVTIKIKFLLNVSSIFGHETCRWRYCPPQYFHERISGSFRFSLGITVLRIIRSLHYLLRITQNSTLKNSGVFLANLMTLYQLLPFL